MAFSTNFAVQLHFEKEKTCLYWHANGPCDNPFNLREMPLDISSSHQQVPWSLKVGEGNHKLIKEAFVKIAGLYVSHDLFVFQKLLSQR